MERDLDHLLDTVKNAKRRGTQRALLLGAGCSVSAGVPTAAGFVKEIENRYPAKFAGARQSGDAILFFY